MCMMRRHPQFVVEYILSGKRIIDYDLDLLEHTFVHSCIGHFLPSFTYSSFMYGKSVKQMGSVVVNSRARRINA